MGCVNVWRAIGWAQQQELLEHLGASLSPVIPLTTSLVWAGLFFGLAAALWRRHRSTRWWLPLSVILYGGYQMLVLTVFVVDAATRGTWPLRLLPVVVFGSFAAWALCCTVGASFWRTEALSGA